MTKLSTLEDFVKVSSSEYYHDLYEWNIHAVKGISSLKRTMYMSQTLKFYTTLHQDTEKFYEQRNVFLKEIRSFEVKNGAIQDTLVEFEGNIIFIELYKMFHILDLYLGALEKTRNSRYENYGLVAFEQDGSYQAQIRHENSFLIKPKVYSDKGPHRLNKFILTGVKNNKFITKFFLHQFIIMDPIKIAFLHNNYFDSELLFKTVEPFFNQQTTTDKIIKSFNILLLSEFKAFLKMKPMKARELTNNISHVLFKQTSNLEDATKYVWLSSSVGFVPIFTCSREDYWTTEYKEMIVKRCQKEFYELFHAEIDPHIFHESMDAISKAPQYQYLLKYPTEFFKINQKYSELIS